MNQFHRVAVSDFVKERSEMQSIKRKKHVNVKPTSFRVLTQRRLSIADLKTNLVLKPEEDRSQQCSFHLFGCSGSVQPSRVFFIVNISCIAPLARMHYRHLRTCVTNPRAVLGSGQQLSW